ncbi:ferredoxin [Algoriphagus machipongonensis]|uniref:Ferredoxin n=1 Tax=Algoriphagus machipongonensis TaxID=388413 RepID=A3I1A3_9BACT|nr:ferredoxin [Algoriphagus machipongonensis]
MHVPIVFRPLKVVPIIEVLYYKLVLMLVKNVQMNAANISMIIVRNVPIPAELVWKNVNL